MAHLAEAGGGGRPDPKARAVGADQARKGRLDLAVALHQCVIVRIADDRRILAMVARVVKGDGGGKIGKLGRGGVGLHAFRVCRAGA